MWLLLTAAFWPITIAVTSDPGPYQFIGVGYNLLSGNIDGGTASKGALDPGLKLTRQILQLTLLQDGTYPEVTYQTHASCTPVSRQSLIYNGQSYQQQLLKTIVPAGSTPSELTQSAFTLSTEFKDVVRATEGDQHTVYHDTVTECGLGTLRYNEELVRVDNFTLTRSFAAAVCALPSEYDRYEYMKFLDQWGTHVVTQVEMGTRYLQRNQTDKATVFQNVRQYEPKLISNGTWFQNYSTSLILDTAGYQASDASHHPLGSQHFTNNIGTTDTPEPIGLQVAPISDLLDSKYWSNGNELLNDGVCKTVDPGNLTTWKRLLETALEQYHTYKNAIPVTDYKLQIPVTWPTGTYGLVQATQGCPEEGVTWLKGWRRQDTEDTPANNQFSSNIGSILAGDFQSNNLQFWYCIKGDDSVTPYDLAWAPGTYCILKYGNCPAGFVSGFVFWDDEDSFNSDRKGGTLPDGTYDKNTKIYYCCREDGPASTEIHLPLDSPFILMRYKGHCQFVHGAHVQEVFIRYDDEDTNNKDSSGGAHPLDDGSSINHQLHFCHYSNALAGDGSSLIG